MRMSQMAALADIVLGDVENLARAYHEIAVARLGDFETEEARRRCAIAVQAVGMAIDPVAYAAAYAHIVGPSQAPSNPDDVAPVCNRCGSAEIVRDASAHWDTATRQWVLGGVYDCTTCQTCEAESDDLCLWQPVPKPVCSHCGSERIVVDAGARWNKPSGQWVLGDLDTCAFCEACEREGSDLLHWLTAAVSQPPASAADKE